MHDEKTFGFIIDTNVKDLSEKRIPEYFLISLWGMYSETNRKKHSVLGVQKNIWKNSQNSKENSCDGSLLIV